jgi:hypothetical protein
MDRIDVLIAHHSGPSFGPPRPMADVDTRLLITGYVAARVAFWLSLGGVVGFVYSYGWLVR